MPQVKSNALPLRWQPGALWQALQPLAPRGYAALAEQDGISVEVLSEIDSTNSALMARARAGDLQPSLLVAERQTAGRGRLGRQWWSQPGGSLTFSLAWPLLQLRDGLVVAGHATGQAPSAAIDWAALSLAVGLAVAEALDPAGTQIGLKWPNDLWLRGDDRKLGGILIESLTVAAPEDCAWAVAQPSGAPGVPAVLRLAIIGVGLNIAAEAPPDGVYQTGYAGLQALDPALDAPAALHRVAPALVAALRRYAESGFAPPLRAAFAARDVLTGRQCRVGPVAAPGECDAAVTGEVRGITDDGSLLMHTAAGIRKINSGEVSVRPC